MNSKSIWPDVSSANAEQPDLISGNITDYHYRPIAEFNKQESEFGTEFVESTEPEGEGSTRSGGGFRAKGQLLTNIVRESFTHPRKSTVISRKTGKIIRRS